MKEYEAFVIGGGPAGITACMYLLRAGVKIGWTEKFAPGGQVLNTEIIENYPGFPEGIKGYELMAKMEKHLSSFEFDRFTDEVIKIEHAYKDNKIKLSGEEVKAKTVIICTGANHKKLGVPGEEEFTGRGVSYCALCDGMFFKDQVVACIGGGNTALEESVYLSKLAKKVYLIHRRDQFRGYKIYQERVLKNPKIEVLYDSVVEEIKGKDNVEEILILNKKTQNKTELKVDGVFIFIGIAPNTNFIPKEMDVDERGFIKTDNEMQTNLPGIFAAGDVRAKTCRQVVTAVGDGAQAAHSAYLFLQKKD